MRLNHSSRTSAIGQMERLISQDAGNRGTKPLVRHGDLLAAAIDLAKSHNVAIMTGFPCLIDRAVPQETDGPLGAMAIARTISKLGRKATLLTDEVNFPVLQACLECYAKEADTSDNFENVRLESFAGGAAWGSAEDMRLEQLAGEIDHVVAIERTGPTAAGTYLTMSAKDMSQMIAPLDRLVGLCTSRAINSTGIGDGGNEVGMGKVLQQVEECIDNGQQIACITKTNNLIVCSVSNWGGYALSAATAVLAVDSLDHLKKDGLIVSEEQEIALCHAMVAAGAADGITGEQELSVDGMPLQTSLEMLRKCRSLAESSFAPL